MKTVRIWSIMAAVMLLGSVSAFSQGKFGPDSANCVNALNFYGDYLKQGNMAEAAPLWFQAMKSCPEKASQNMYINGAKILKYLINKAKSDPARKQRLVDSLIMVHQKRADLFPKYRQKALENKVFDMMTYFAEDDKTVFDENAKVIYLSPQGKVLNQKMVEDLSKQEHLILLCGHYEGIDQRVIDKIVDEEISIGDYVLTGGEIPAMVLMDSVCRYVEGVLKKDSISEESFSQGILEYPQYTRPEVFMGEKVPEVLLTGHHANIRKWRRKQALKNTYLKRPGLLDNIELSKEDQKLLIENND